MLVERSKPTMVTLDGNSPAFVAAALRRLPGVEVIDGAPSSSLVRAGGVEPLRVEVATIADLRNELDAPTRPPNGERRLVAVTGILDVDTASRLEDLGIAFADVNGRAWMPGQQRSGRARTRRDTAPQHLRPESLRLAQLLVDHPRERWTQRSLASRGDSTLSLIHI